MPVGPLAWPPTETLFSRNPITLEFYGKDSFCSSYMSSPGSRTPAACPANMRFTQLAYCGSVRSSLRDWPLAVGGAGRQAIYRLTDLQASRRDARISVCSPDLDFVPTLYLYIGCPGTATASVIKQSAGCELTLTEYYSLPLSTHYYVVVEGTIISSQTGNFTLSVRDPECNGTSPAAPTPNPNPGGSTTPGSGSGSGSGEQCFPYAAPTTYYSVQCPGPMTVSRLEPVTYNGNRVCGALVPDLRRFLFADWGTNITLTQSPAAGTPLLPAIPDWPTNNAWSVAGLPTSGTGTTQVQFSITNNSGKGPRGNCTFALTVVDQDGPLAQAICPPMSQDITVAPNQCTADAPDLKSQVTFDSSCMRPISTTLTQSIAPGTPLAVGNTYTIRLYSSSRPNGASCEVKLAVRRSTAPQHAYASGATATPSTLTGVVGGRPALVPVSLRYTFADSCPDHAKLCRLEVRQTGDALASAEGQVVLSGSPYALWNQTCASDLAAVQLSPYVDPSFVGPSGTTVRTYSVMLGCSYGFGLESRLAWEVPVKKP
eukprot:tig00021037_g17478.t1